ncbi:MAG: ABC transporter ATP-binding protein [Rhodanobacter sp.]|nr:MAG: ABC transporter ATP-binding protein [Rhodanobacter sp.]TAM08540.1 MAG: ABC transporter ATP-binding protein [Rhodanobacter sp.]TAM34903.1 MAG: ABC transporter ATP-binding protein [Rhodanobacter sp.]
MTTDSSEPAADAAPSVWAELTQLAGSARALLGAHGRLLGAELGLAHRALTGLLASALVAIALAVALGLTVLGLLGVLLAGWLHSWPLALALLALLQMLLLGAAIAAFRCCLHWLSLPASRRAWAGLLQTPRATERTGGAP